MNILLSDDLSARRIISEIEGLSPEDFSKSLDIPIPTLTGFTRSLYGDAQPFEESITPRQIIEQGERTTENPQEDMRYNALVRTLRDKQKK